MSSELTKKIITAEDILQNPPPGVDLTIVGGQALIYWTLSYQQRYPDMFKPEIIGSTYDVDFVVQLKAACEECRRHWGGTLHTPDSTDPTPELGVLTFNDKDHQLRVDLLASLFRFTKKEILKHRNPIGKEGTEYEHLYVLSEWGVLLNRVFNTISHPKYHHPESLTQVHNAIRVYHCRLKWLLDDGDIAAAQSECNQLLSLAKMSRVGMRLFLDFGIDLMDAIPLNDERFEPLFVEKGLSSTIEQIQGKRARLQKDRAKRAAEKGG